MNNFNPPHLSRRRFIAAAGLGATVAFVPRLLFAQKKGIVPTMIDDAARARIGTHRLRRGISVLEGSGGNIAVLTGKDGKLLIDSGFSVSKTRVVEALNNLSAVQICRPGHAGSKTFKPSVTGSECGYACHTKVASRDYIFTEYPLR